jgi:hypothetical protein
MENTIRSGALNVKKSRKSIRLTFRVSDGRISLISYERLDMISPPSVGEAPEAGKYGGFWMELRNANDRVLSHRSLHLPIGNSVEVHSPDGKIHREFGDVKEGIFEVLLPDDANARFITLMGEYLDPAKAREKRTGGSRELARFNLPEGEKGGEE